MRRNVASVKSGHQQYPVKHVIYKTGAVRRPPLSQLSGLQNNIYDTYMAQKSAQRISTNTKLVFIIVVWLSCLTPMNNRMRRLPRAWRQRFRLVYRAPAGRLLIRIFRTSRAECSLQRYIMSTNHPHYKYRQTLTLLASLL